MMSILILNRFPYSWKTYDKFKEIADDVVFLSDQKVAELYTEDNYALIESFPTFHNNDAVSLYVKELHQVYQFDHIVAVSEYDLVRAAELREHLGIAGQTLESTEQFRNKIKMKEILVDKCEKIRIPQFKEIKDIFDLVTFIKAVGYPILLKPVDGAGASGITILNNEKDLWEFAKDGIHHKLDAEEFFKGEEFHIDGVVENGDLKLICVSKYMEPMFHYHNNNFISGSYMLQQDNHLRLKIEDAISEVISHMNFPKYAVFHAECLVTATNEIIFIEIACRPGGGRISKAIEASFGYDLMPFAAELQAGIVDGFQYLRKVPDTLSGTVQVLSKEGTLLSFPKTDPPKWVYEYIKDVEEGTTFGDPKNSCDSVASFVVTGETEEEVQSRLLGILDWFESNVTWSYPNRTKEYIG